MHLLRLGCFALLLTMSAPSSALIDGYYSQAVDIDYALPGENESIRIKLERAFKKLLEMVTIDDEGLSMGFKIDYGSDGDIASGQ